MGSRPSLRWGGGRCAQGGLDADSLNHEFAEIVPSLTRKISFRKVNGKCLGGPGSSAPSRRPGSLETVTEIVVITGMSGAGRTQVGNALEDLGWFVIDNLPASLIPKLAELVG